MSSATRSSSASRLWVLGFGAIPLSADSKRIISSEDLDTFARHLASPGGLPGALGVYRAIAAEAPALVQLTNTKLTIPVGAVGGDHSMGMGPFEQFQQLAESVTGASSTTADIGS